jgi:hypothetical protein
MRRAPGAGFLHDPAAREHRGRGPPPSGGRRACQRPPRVWGRWPQSPGRAWGGGPGGLPLASMPSPGTVCRRAPGQVMRPGAASTQAAARPRCGHGGEHTGGLPRRGATAPGAAPRLGARDPAAAPSRPAARALARGVRGRGGRQPGRRGPAVCGPGSRRPGRASRCWPHGWAYGQVHQPEQGRGRERGASHGLEGQARGQHVRAWRGAQPRHPRVIARHHGPSRCRQQRQVRPTRAFATRPRAPRWRRGLAVGLSHCGQAQSSCQSLQQTQEPPRSPALAVRLPDPLGTIRAWLWCPVFRGQG